MSQALTRADRRDAQLGRNEFPIGFDAVSNNRVDLAIIEAASAFASSVGVLHPSVEHWALAAQQVSQTLPSARGQRYRAPRPSKSDEAAYRRGNR